MSKTRLNSSFEKKNSSYYTLLLDKMELLLIYIRFKLLIAI